MLLNEENLIHDYTERIKRSNERLDYWCAYLKDRFFSDSKFAYRGICILDVLVTGLAVRDWISSSPYYGRRGSGKSVLLDARNVLKEYIKILQAVSLSVIAFFREKKRKARTGKTVFVAFERRQAGAFIDAMDILRERARLTGVLTTRVAAHGFPPNFDHCHNVAYIEDFFRAGASGGLLVEYSRSRKWLDRVLQESVFLPKDLYAELYVFIKEIRAQLLRALFFIDSAYSFISVERPRAVLAADNADGRARAVFLTAKKAGIPTYHVPFGFIDLECYEEKYPVAGRKFVFSAQQKEILMHTFNLREEMLTVLGCPRFDNLFRIRGKTGVLRGGAAPFTIIFGSQPSTKNGYSPFVKEIKMRRIGDLLHFICCRRMPVKLLFKPHPDESDTDIREISVTAKRMGIDFEVIERIDFEQIKNRVDFFISFESMLSLEFIILGIPVGFLVSVNEVPILKKACEQGLAVELPAGNDWESVVRAVCALDNGRTEARESYLSSEFTNTDGTASRELVDRLLAEIK